MKDIRKRRLQDITPKTFRDAIMMSMNEGITNVAPLGRSGETIILYETANKTTSRSAQVSIRNYCGDPELLITDFKGKFLFYGRLCYETGLDTIVNTYYSIFKMHYKNIKKEVPPKDVEQRNKVKRNHAKSNGFNWIDWARFS